MKNYTTFKQIIDLWPTRQALADALSQAKGERVLVSAVNRWLIARKIPAKHWPVIMAAAKAHGFDGVTLEVMGEIEKNLILEGLKNG